MDKVQNLSNSGYMRWPSVLDSAGNHVFPSTWFILQPTRLCNGLTSALSKWLDRVNGSLLSLEEGTRSVFGKVVFSSYLDFRTMDKAHKPSDSELKVWLLLRSSVLACWIPLFRKWPEDGDSPLTFGETGVRIAQTTNKRQMIRFHEFHDYLTGEKMFLGNILHLWHSSVLLS
jgi:hypothetical protein